MLSQLVLFEDTNPERCISRHLVAINTIFNILDRRFVDNVILIFVGKCGADFRFE